MQDSILRKNVEAIRLNETDTRLIPQWALNNTINRIHLRPSLQPRSAFEQRLEQTGLFRPTNNAVLKMIAVQHGVEGRRVYEALAGTSNPAPTEAKVYALRVKAPLFGHNSLKPGDFGITDANRVDSTNDWKPITSVDIGADNATSTVLWLDTVYDKIAPNTPIAIVTAADDKSYPTLRVATHVEEVSRSDYKLSSKCSRITLPEVSPWSISSFAAIRKTIVYAQAEVLELAEMPVVNALSPQKLELNTVADGLEPGNWVIVSGERIIGDITGVQGAELAMLAKVEHIHDADLPTDRTVTHLTFVEDLEYRFKPSTVVVYGNVVKATHGETRTEVLGSGDGSQALQSFALQQKPLTYLAAVTPRGAESTLEVRVNDLLWHESDNMAAQSPTDRVFSAITDDADKTTIHFGNGEHGARLPTGAENVRAKHRIGIGRPSNLGAGKISILSTRPLGVKAVTNPIRASGGVDRETRDQARKNTPLATRSLGRIVSVSDYADFAKSFAGIGKGHAVRLIDGTQSLVYLTVAGAEDAPIDETSDLYRNLVAALRRYGDPYQAVQVALRDLLALMISADVKILPDYEWESVKPKLEARLLDQFSFERRDLGQDVTASEVISVVQKVPGVAYVDLNILDSLSKEWIDILASASEKDDTLQSANLTLRSRIIAELPDLNRLDLHEEIAPAQLIYLRPDLKETLVLNRITP